MHYNVSIYVNKRPSDSVLTSKKEKIGVCMRMISKALLLFWQLLLFSKSAEDL